MTATLQLPLGPVGPCGPMIAGPWRSGRTRNAPCFRCARSPTCQTLDLRSPRFRCASTSRRHDRCVALSEWRDRVPTPRQQRRSDLDAAVAAMFDDAGSVHGSPRLHVDLRATGWVVTEKTVADSMRRQGLVARTVKRGRCTTQQDPSAPKFPDLLRRDFTAPAPNLRWCGDITEIPTAAGKLYLATVIDLYSRRLLAAATSLRCDAELCEQAIKIAATVRGGKTKINNVVFHTDRGSTGGFQWSSQHLDNGGVLGWDGGRGRWRYRQRRWAVGASGLRIGRYDRRCVHRGGRSLRVLCSVGSGV
jgi:hypothetical protein